MISALKFTEGGDYKLHTLRAMQADGEDWRSYLNEVIDIAVLSPAITIVVKDPQLRMGEDFGTLPGLPMPIRTIELAGLTLEASLCGYSVTTSSPCSDQDATPPGSRGGATRKNSMLAVSIFFYSSQYAFTTSCSAMSHA